MSRNRSVLDENAILDELNDSDFGGDSDEDENWMPPGEEPDSSSDEGQEEDHAAPVTAVPTARNTWTRRTFRGKPMPSVTLTVEEVLSPAEYFEQYFPEEVYQKFALYTNMYYQTTNNQVLKQPVTAAEIKKFFGINGILGCVKYPRIKMAWLQRFRLPYISDALTRDRFFLIRTNLHIVDKSAVTPEEMARNRLWLVQPLIDSVRNRCLQLPRNHGTYSIDEQMVPFLGRCPVKQYVPGKPRPVGLKNFVITTSKGLIIDFEFYQGNTTPFPDITLGLGPSVVLRLISTLPKGSWIFFDRYFTTIPLMEKLITEQIEGTGTLMTNRFKGFTFPKDSQMRRGEYQEIVNSQRNVCVVKWKDNKSVLMASTCLGAQPVENVQRWDKSSRSYVTVPCPNMVKKYNENMGGVDVSDQMLEVYRCWHKTRKWPLKVFMHLFDMAIVNSWYEYREACKANRQKPMDFLDFKLTVSDYLLGGTTRKRQRDALDDMAEMPTTSHYTPATMPTADKRYDGYNHWPISDTLKAPRCCRLESCSSRSKVRCTKCNVYLCLSKDHHCFYVFHNKQ